ncbi:SPW repeat protein [soil metagenome]
MHLVSTKVHGYADYSAGALLVASPWLFGFFMSNYLQAAWYTSVGAGTALVLYSLFTQYELGAVKLIVLKTHLILDVILGAFLIASPWAFHFDKLVFAPHVALGAGLILSAALTHWKYLPRRARALFTNAF